MAYGANIPRIDSRGPPLSHLAVQGCLPVTTELLEVFGENGINMDAVDREGKTILHHGGLASSIDVFFGICWIPETLISMRKQTWRRLQSSTRSKKRTETATPESLTDNVGRTP